MTPENRDKVSLMRLFLTAFKLGLTSFGGPIAHLGYFHNEYVRNKKWINEKKYADLVALCQFLPGPASSQVGMGIGINLRGIPGGIVSFLGFTIPSAAALIIFALILQKTGLENAPWIHGLKIVAAAVVAHAISGMAEKLTTNLRTKGIALAALAAALLFHTVFTQVAVIIAAGIAGYFLFSEKNKEEIKTGSISGGRTAAYICLALFFILLFGLPLLREASGLREIAFIDSFYRSGSLVFGGGHVVLPLLEREFVPSGWLNRETFLAGYGAAQAVPGPLFTISAYLGTIIYGWQGGLIAVASIFLPAFLLIAGIIPFWEKLRNMPSIQGALTGVNAAVVGILISAFYDPIWTSSILSGLDFAFAAVLFSMLAFWKMQPWIIVLAGAIGRPLADIILQVNF